MVYPANADLVPKEESWPAAARPVRTAFLDSDEGRARPAATPRFILFQDGKVVLTVTGKAASPHVRVDQGQVEQVVMNLVINAAQAMGPERGTITIRTGAGVLRSPRIRHSVACSVAASSSKPRPKTCR